MQGRRLAVAWAALTLGGAFGMSAQAASVTETYNFDIGPFTGGTTNGGTVVAQPAPIDPWLGSFTVTFNPSITATTSGVVSAFSSNITALGTAWDYVTYASGGNYYLEIGNDCNLSTNNCVDQNGSGFIPNDGFLTLQLGSASSPNVTTPTFNAAEYTTTAGGSGLVPHFSGSAGAIPEPASFALLGAGMLLLGGIRHAMRQTVRGRRATHDAAGS